MPSPALRPAADVARDVRNAADDLVGAKMIDHDRRQLLDIARAAARQGLRHEESLTIGANLTAVFSELLGTIRQ